MKKLLSITAAVLSVFIVSAQCPQISCPSNITVNNAPGTCGAVVNYTTPVGTNPCGAGSQTFSYTGSVQTYTVPNGITSVSIESIGAQGGNGGGLGARIIGDFTVIPGETYNIMVGQMGTMASNNNGGGGGGSFVWNNNGNTLVIAAGGGGGRSGNSNNGQGGPGSDSNTPSASINGSGNGAGGTSGNGGVGGIGISLPSYSGAGGGGSGWNTNGLNGTGTLYNATGGLTPLSGGTGGTGYNPCESANVVGGYGGGGGGGGCSGASGGGGGYNGGGGGNDWNGQWGSGGGGGSFNSGTNQSNTAGYQSGNGQVIISWTSGPATTTQISGLPDGATFPVGTTTNWYKVEDGLGNKDSCSFTVTVVDNEAPSISCPSDTTICWGIYNASVSTTDNCPGETIAQIAGPTLGSSFDVGTYNLIFVVTDASGNKDTCDYDVTVEICGGVNENNTKYGISVYPNPMKEFVVIENKNIEGSYTIEITNTLGAIVKTITTTEKRVEIQKGAMSKGMYYYNIKQNNQTISSGKLAVE